MLDWQKGVVTRLKENTQVNWNDIAHAVEENPESLRKFWQRERLIKDLPPKVVLPKKGKITATIGVKLKKKQKEEPKISFRKLAGWIHETEGVKIHHSSIADYFNRNRWMTLLMPYKIPLRPMNRAKRLAFAQKYIEDWDSIYRVLWSDETSPHQAGNYHQSSPIVQGLRYSIHSEGATRGIQCHVLGLFFATRQGTFNGSRGQN